MCSALKLPEENRHLNRHLMEIICTKNLKKEKKKKKAVLSVHLLAKYKNICEEK